MSAWQLTGRVLVYAALAVGAAVAAAMPAAVETGPLPSRWSGVVSHVTDGDTLWVRPAQGGAPRKIRLDGIDAPEICQAHGAQARAALEQRLLHRTIELAVRRVDDYQRPLARVRLQGEDIGRWLVQQGHAWSYHYRRNVGPYAAEERQARTAQRGLFADPNAERPRAFRQRHGPCE